MGGAQLTASADQTALNLGQSVKLAASLQDATIQTGNALIRRPDGTSESLPLAADGNQYSLIYKPSQKGLYNVELSVTGQASDGTTIDRAASLSFEVNPAVARSKRAGNPWVTAAALGMFTLALLIVVVLKRYLKKR